MKLDSGTWYENKRIITKILKLDESNQYGFAKSKPLHTGCIKKEEVMSWRKFYLLLKTVDLDDRIGHLLVLDIHFNYKNATSRQLLYSLFNNKHKIIAASESSVYELTEQYSETDKGIPCTYRCTHKTHATLFAKTFQPLYVEHIKFLIRRAGGKVTKTCSYFSFEQERFKKDFMLMNQHLRQNAKNPVEKDFFKLLNNANFGYDCCNNLDKCKFIQYFTN